MKKYARLYNALILIVLCMACDKEPAHPPQNNHKDILDFRMEAIHNNGILSDDVIGVIRNDSIDITFAETTELSHLIATFTTTGQAVYVGKEKQESTVTENDFSQEVIYTVQAEDGSRKDYVVTTDVREVPTRRSIAHLYVQTKGGADITSKENYVHGTLKVEGTEIYPDYTGEIRIRGRGNSTWHHPKKPYKIKLDKASSLLGLPEGKKWILLSNYLDGTLMLNAIAMKMGQLVELPFTNTIIPVDVTINGTYLGNYMFMEHKEVAPRRVELQEGGLWLELDTYYDEAYKFKSANYHLPVMVKYPDLEDYSPQIADSLLNTIKSEFNIMEQAVFADAFPDNNYLEYIDADAMVDYLMVYNLCQNEEVNHPKSTYMYRPVNGKFTMGPIWDFDWAFDYESHHKYFTTYTKPLFWSDSEQRSGSRFFGRFMTDPAIRKMYKQQWRDFRSEKFQLLIQYLDEYAASIKDSQERDYSVWQRGSGNFSSDVAKLRQWLHDRASYIDQQVAAFD